MTAEKKQNEKNEEKEETPQEIVKDIEKTGVPQEIAKKEEKLDEKSAAKKKTERPKKTEAVVNGIDIPVSTKQSAAICKFIKGKKIPEAIENLEMVARLKMAVPMTGEIPHRKGKMMAGRFPGKAAKEFIVLLKSLGANANYNGIENPRITTAIANIGARPFGRYGVRRKRTHITLIAKAISGGKK